MKKTTIIIIIAVALGALAIFAFRNHGRNQERDSIVRVLKVRNIIENDVFSRAGLKEQFWDGSALVGEWCDRLKSAEMDGCPQDFRLAYLRYTSEVEQLYRVKSSNEGWNGAVKAFFTGGLHVPGAYKEMDQIFKRLLDAKEEMKAIAISHGVE